MIAGPRLKGGRSLLRGRNLLSCGEHNPSAMERRYSSTVIPLARAWSEVPLLLPA
jgi:hypothetical protein